MNRMIVLASLVAACSASAQFVQVATPQPPAQIVQPQAVVVPQQTVQQVTTTTVQPVQQVTTTTVIPPATTVVQPAPTTIVQPAPTIVVPAGYQTCPRCGGRGKEEHALGFKLKRCKLCDGKGYLPPPPPPVHHHHHHHRR